MVKTIICTPQLDLVYLVLYAWMIYSMADIYIQASSEFSRNVWVSVF